MFSTPDSESGKPSSNLGGTLRVSAMTKWRIRFSSVLSSRLPSYQSHIRERYFVRNFFVPQVPYSADSYFYIETIVYGNAIPFSLFIIFYKSICCSRHYFISRPCANWRLAGLVSQTLASEYLNCDVLGLMYDTPKWPNVSPN